MKEVCIEIEKRYQMKFLEIGTDKDHAHFLVQSIPTYSASRIVSIIKSITSPGDTQEAPGKETTVGRRVLDGWVFYSAIFSILPLSNIFVSNLPEASQWRTGA